MKKVKILEVEKEVLKKNWIKKSIYHRKNKELEGNGLYGIMRDVFKDLVSGKITKSQLEKLQKQFLQN